MRLGISVDISSGPGSAGVGPPAWGRGGEFVDDDGTHPPPQRQPVNRYSRRAAARPPWKSGSTAPPVIPPADLAGIYSAACKSCRHRRQEFTALSVNSRAAIGGSAAARVTYLQRGLPLCDHPHRVRAASERPIIRLRFRCGKHSFSGNPVFARLPGICPAKRTTSAHNAAQSFRVKRQNRPPRPLRPPPHPPR